MTAVPPPSASAAARVERDGTIVVSAGPTSTGQGHETAYAQLASTVLGVPMADIRVVQSDTAQVGSGRGTFGSRSLQLGGSAIRGACVTLVEKARQETARRLEAGADDIVRFDGGRFGVRGVPDSALSWAQLASSEVVLVAEHDFTHDDQAYSFGCHVAVSEGDVETGDARLVRHVAVGHCARLPTLTLVEAPGHEGAPHGAAHTPRERVR